MATTSEDLLRSIASLLDGLDVALCVFDDQDRSLLWNRAFLQLFPEHQSHVTVGEPYRDNLRRFYEGRLGPDELPQIEDYIQAGIVRHRTQHQPFEFEHRGRFVKASSLPLPGVGRMRLWSQRVSRAEDSAKNGRRRSDTLTGATDAGRVLLDRVPDGLMICGRDGRIQWVNEPLVRMYGLPTRADARGATLAALYRSAWRDCGPEQAQQMADGLTTLEDNLRFSGAPFELPLPGNRFTRIITQPIHADEAFYAHVDITEIKRQQHQLARLNQDLTHSTQQARDASLSKSQFLANMSHEIRTPMHAILGLLELLQTTTLDHEQRDYVDKTRGAGRSLLTLLDDILDLSKVEAGRMTLDPQPFELEQLLRDLSVILSASVGDKPLELLFDIEPGLPAVLIGDQKRLHQILLNLASNAVKFTSRGTVLIRLRTPSGDGSHITLGFEVIDTGIGIAPEHLDPIFTGFSQAEASTTRRFGGTGLGLSISQRLVQLMGGRISVASTLGLGSTFSFALQLPIAAAAAPPHQPDTRALKPAGTVLIADDSLQAADLMAGMVHQWGWRADVAATSGQALALLGQRKLAGQPGYDVVIVDARLPEPDGWALVRQLRQDELGAPDANPVVVVVANSYRDAPSLRAAEDRALVQGFLVKPITSHMLLEAILLADVAPTGTIPATPPQPKARRLIGLRVLVVEDNPVNQQVAQGLLRSEGALVSIAGNGQLGVEAVAAASPQFDVVLMDVQMPILDGMAATLHIRDELGLLALPIVAMTANTMAHDLEACTAAGMSAHVGKPFHLDQLVDVLTRLAPGGAGSRAGAG